MIAATLFWLCLLMAAAVSVAATMAMLSLILSYNYSPMPLARALGEIAWTASNDAIMFAIPLYILMGEILMRSGIAERMYESDAALDVLAAGRADERQHRLLRDLFRSLRIRRGDCGHHRHRRHPGDANATATTSGCSSARSRPAARSTS